MKVLLLGDCLKELKSLRENSIDSIVTDPPYGLSFMNKRWDYDVPSTEIWTECLRVLKPGGHLLSFGGSRTYHRMAVRIEDAGFEIRDQIMWIYGSGFPKSHNIGKAVDKLQGNEREVVGTETTPYKVKGKDDDGVTWDNKTFCSKTDENGYRINEITKGQSEWEGWGTALKPAHEPIVVARKPLSEKSVAENVLKWGTGGLNIDVSRIGTEQIKSYQTEKNVFNPDYETKATKDFTISEGRWPANIILDEEAGQILDEQSGIKQGNERKIKYVNYGLGEYGKKDGRKTEPTPNEIEGTWYGDKGGASRFFYCPKASKKDRDEGLDMMEEKHNKTWNERLYTYPDGTERPEYKLKNNHPTVKPTSLMEYLIKLVTPVGGTVLDPFMGSGSTGKAAIRGGFDFVGIEREEEYIKIAEARINNEIK